MHEDFGLRIADWGVKTDASPEALRDFLAPLFYDADGGRVDPEKSIWTQIKSDERG